MLDRVSTCLFTTVHGFSKKIYEVEEGEMAEVVLQKNVKGTSSFSELNLLLIGEITSVGVNASEWKYTV